ncbi:hypothetical protein M9458_008743, partial [Cirrhinus mrigala]
NFTAFISISVNNDTIIFIINASVIKMDLIKITEFGTVFIFIFIILIIFTITNLPKIFIINNLII